jgi:hypothetical protein
MTVADWRVTLGEVARSNVAGLIVFPGSSLTSDGRGDALRVMVDEQR